MSQRHEKHEPWLGVRDNKKEIMLVQTYDSPCSARSSARSRSASNMTSLRATYPSSIVQGGENTHSGCGNSGKKKRQKKHALGKDRC